MSCSNAIRANEIETPETLAAKLEWVGHVSPDIQMTSEEGNRRAREIARATPTEKFDRSLSAYLMVRDEVPTWRDRLAVIVANVWPKISHAAIGMGIVLATAIALIVGCAVTAKGVEVPDRIVAALAAVETGTEWCSFGNVRGNFTRGAIGEVGPWQLSPAVLRDLSAYDRRSRIHADPVLAESLTRAWLLRLYGVTGCWSQTVAAFHAGLAGRHRPHARAYAERVINIAGAL